MHSSLYIASTGMQTQSRGMQVVGNNLANVSTVGFKQSMALYQDLTSSNVPAPSNNITNLSQKGHGATFSAARTIFNQGGFESSNTITDLAIANGNGYFGVMQNGEMLYTKAGNMRFDKEGRLLDPTGANLVGRKVLNGVVSGTYEPIQVDTSEGSPILTNPPRATTSASIFSNIGGVKDMSENTANPLFAMTSRWNGTSSPPLGAGQYGYSNPITVYDDQGAAHSMTVYYDYVGTQNGVKLYEYAVGIEPGEDASAKSSTKAAGLLMSGTMSFASNGDLIGLSAYTPTGSDPTDLAAYAQAPLLDGLPSMQVNFSGTGPQQISLNLGGTMTGYNGGTTPADGAMNAEQFYEAAAGFKREKGGSVAYGESSSVNQLSKQDGYAKGELHDLHINADGFITARYTNGQTEDLYQISLFRFKSQDGLRHEGKNHYSATSESGAADEGLPNTENYGKILSQTLETSNVDMAREFSNMIVTQRGFQANSKIITTSDAMLQKALELKR